MKKKNNIGFAFVFASALCSTMRVPIKNTTMIKRSDLITNGEVQKILKERDNSN